MREFRDGMPEVLGVQFDADELSAEAGRGQARGSPAHERVENPLTTMRFESLWTLVWAKFGNLVPAIDDGADGMLFLTAEAAEAEAIRQTNLYADTGAGESIRAVSVSVDCPG